MRNRRGVFAAVCLIAVRLVAPGSMYAEPPPAPDYPEGYEEWKKTGNLPNSLYLRNRDGIHGALLSNPESPFAPRFSVWDKDNRTRRELRIDCGDRRPMASSTYATVGYIFNVGDGDVIPLFDQIYAVHVDNRTSGDLVLWRVTDRVPKEMRPGLKTRTISTAAVSAELFWQQNPQFENRQDYDSVELKFEPPSGKAVLHLYPAFTFRPPLTEQGKLPIRDRLQLEVAKGGLLSARGRSYKVLNVVPPQDIDGVGHLVGWIELAPDPVEGETDKTSAK